jgi:uncharacterized membrane protein
LVIFIAPDCFVKELQWVSDRAKMKALPGWKTGWGIPLYKAIVFYFSPNGLIDTFQF